MPWNLYIHTIDVGQGESSLLIATNPGTGQHRTMLIDGGLPGCAATVHRYVANELLARGIAVLDHIVTSHYDEDHAGGIIGLLIADDLFQLTTQMTPLITAAAITGINRAERVACAAMAATAFASGVYDDPTGNNMAAQILVMCAAMRLAGVAPGLTDLAAGNWGINYGLNNVPLGANAGIQLGIMNRRTLARQAGITAANAIAINPGTAAVAVQATVLQRLMTQLPTVLRFSTNGLYTNTHLIDIGNTGHIPQEYTMAVVGQFTNRGGSRVRVPAINRARTTAALGAEVLWGTGAGAGVLPANAPGVFVVAANANIWQGPNAPVVIHTGQPENDDSIGLIVRFNDFFFYTGGDLPSAGEDPMATAVRAHGLPNTVGGTFAAAGRIASFKCGHHGSGNSTSAAFLVSANPVTAMISCGRNQFGPENHPNQLMVTRLVNRASILNFYLTNCKYVTVGIRASNGQDQLVVGNKSRVAGDNADNNLAVVRNRGNIALELNQDESLAANGAAHQFRMHYFDVDVLLGVLVGQNTTVKLF